MKSNLAESSSATANANNDDARYSLRERVARLEDFMEDQRSRRMLLTPAEPMGNQSSATVRADGIGTVQSGPISYGPAPRTFKSDSLEGFKYPSAKTSFHRSPVVSLYDNHLFTKITSPPNSRYPRPGSSALQAARYELLALMPSDPDLDTLCSLSGGWWRAAPHRFRELFSLEDFLPQIGMPWFTAN